jgi:hypothetical protein
MEVVDRHLLPGIGQDAFLRCVSQRSAWRGRREGCPRSPPHRCGVPAAFIAMTSWQGELTDDYFAQPTPDPAQFGMQAEDDGSRDDPLLSDRSWAISNYRPDVVALAAAPTRIVIAVGEKSMGTFTGRTSVATAELLGQQPTVFPSHHGGFVGGKSGYAGKPEAFALRLREVLDDDN